jgi:muramoyltetrapeptide carboxypeptidase
MISDKLKKGDEIRVIAPSRSLSVLSEEIILSAIQKLEKQGYVVSLSTNCKEIDETNSSKVESRVSDLHEAFLDSKVKAILTVIGGSNVNQILGEIDYDIIKNNPKILCGFSDITALTNAIYSQTGLVTYSGPHFSTFAMQEGFEYTQKYFDLCLTQNEPFDVESSIQWSDDAWFSNQHNRNFVHNEGVVIINEGVCSGTIIGGNLCTLNLLQGTKFMPDLKDVILFIEDDNLLGESFPSEFDRNLQSLIQNIGFEKVRGVIIGRCQNGCSMDLMTIKRIIKSKRDLIHIPVIYGADFGHTSPLFTFPIGGKAEIMAKNNKFSLTVIEH